MDFNSFVYVIISLLSFLLIIFGFTALVYLLKKFNKSQNSDDLSSNSSKRCSKLKEDNFCSSYGTCEEKSSTFSSDSHTWLRPVDDKNRPGPASNFIQKLKNLKTKFSNNQTSESIDLERLPRMSSINSSASYASLSSLATILSNDHLPKHHTPSMILNYSLHLDPNKQSLSIDLVSLENVKLPISLVQSNIDLNVYIKIELLEPNRNIYTNISQKLCAKTRMIKNRSNPVFEETFEFTSLNDLFESLIGENLDESATRFRLVFNVCNSNLFGRDQIIGLCVHTFKKDDLYLADNFYPEKFIPRIFSKKIDLVDSKSSDINLGQLKISLNYNSKTRTIQIHILKAIGLQLPKYFLDSDKIPNSYVKIYMIYRGQRVDKKQTKIVMETRDPIFDQKFEFNILNLLQLSQPMDNASFEPESSEIEEKNDTILSHQISSRIQFVFLVMDWDKVEKNDVIGKLELNTQHHVQRLIRKQNLNIESSNSDPGQLSSQNWFDIFHQTNQSIICTFQIKNY